MAPLLSTCSTTYYHGHVDFLFYCTGNDLGMLWIVVANHYAIAVYTVVREKNHKPLARSRNRCFKLPYPLSTLCCVNKPVY